MKIREHRGGLRESMETVVEIAPSIEAIVSHIRECWGPFHPEKMQNITAEMVTVEKYGGIDSRIGWDTHIVDVEGLGVFGMTDGPLLI